MNAFRFLVALVLLSFGLAPAADSAKPSAAWIVEKATWSGDSTAIPGDLAF